MTELQQQLFALQDETYREFHSKLMPVSTGCVLINKNEPRKFNVSGVLLCVFLQ